MAATISLASPSPTPPFGLMSPYPTVVMLHKTGKGEQS
jgi:hypothetical protein